ncbi:MAG TPA: sugar phosphate isomerase/epimerase family protein [Armatimonadota bacterium]
MREPVIPTFLRSDLSLGELLEHLAEEQVTMVEVLGDLPNRSIDLSDSAAVLKLKEIAERAGIKIHSLHNGFSNPSAANWDISSPDETVRRAAIARSAAVLRAGSYLGARHVVVHPGHQERSLERLECCKLSLGELAKTARELDVRIAVENLPPDYLGGRLSETKYLLDGLDPQTIGFCCDTGHAALGAESAAEYIRAFPDRLIGVHWHLNDGENDCHWCPIPVGDESKAFIQALNEAGYDLPVVIEAAPPEGMTIHEMVECARAELNSSFSRNS